MLAVHDLEIRVGARTLMSDVSFRVSDGDKKSFREVKSYKRRKRWLS